MPVRIPIGYREPRDLLVESEHALDRIPSNELFNSAAHQKLREQWCASMFGIGYANHVRPSRVAVNEGRYREDADFFVEAADVDWGFQLAEVQRPNRRRGQEYRQLADGGVHLSAYQPGRGDDEGAEWLANAIDQKLGKHYASSNTLNLLLYANFDFADFEYTKIQGRLAQYSSQFSYVWVMTNLHMCSIFSSSELGELNGWRVIREVRDYYL